MKGAKECPSEEELLPLLTGQRPLRVPVCGVGPAKGCGPESWRGGAGAASYLEPQEPRPGVGRQVFGHVGVQPRKVQGVGGTQDQRRHSGSAFVPCEGGQVTHLLAPCSLCPRTTGPGRQAGCLLPPLSWHLAR